MGSVNITLANGQLGQTVQTDDGVVGFVMTGGIDGTGDYALGTPILIRSLKELTAAGITTDGNEFAVRQVTDFYNAAGVGAKLYLMLVPNTMTVDMIADKANDSGAKKLLDYAAGKIRVLGIVTDDANLDGEVTVASGLNEDVATAVTNAQSLAKTYFQQQMPFRVVIGGTSYSGVPADLTALTEGTENRVSVIIGDTVEDSQSAAVGLLLGRIASIPVMRKIGRVRDGALPISAAYLGADAVEDKPYDPDTIADAGYITWATYVRRSGYYFGPDNMACATTDDYASLARGRVIDKAHILAYEVFVNEIDDEVDVDPTSGKISAGKIRSLEQSIENQFATAMKGEIVLGSATVDPDQNVLSTNTVEVDLAIIPKGYSTVINITLGFTNPALEA